MINYRSGKVKNKTKKKKLFPLQDAQTQTVNQSHCHLLSNFSITVGTKVTIVVSQHKTPDCYHMFQMPIK